MTTDTGYTLKDFKIGDDVCIVNSYPRHYRVTQRICESIIVINHVNGNGILSNQDIRIHPNCLYPANSPEIKSKVPEILTVVKNYNETGEIDLSLPWFESVYHELQVTHNLTPAQFNIFKRLSEDGLDCETALVLASRFYALNEDDDGYTNVKDAVQELMFWHKQPEGPEFWILYNHEHKKKYNP